MSRCWLRCLYFLFFNSRIYFNNYYFTIIRVTACAAGPGLEYFLSLLLCSLAAQTYSFSSGSITCLILISRCHHGTLGYHPNSSASPIAASPRVHLTACTRCRYHKFRLSCYCPDLRFQLGHIHRWYRFVLILYSIINFSYPNCLDVVRIVITWSSLMPFS